MANEASLGEFELIVLLALLRLESKEQYGVPISAELRKVTGREVTLGSIYAALDRLERKGFVTSQLGDPTPQRGGRAKRYFDVTKEGMNQVKATRSALIKLWQGIPKLKSEIA